MVLSFLYILPCRNFSPFHLWYKSLDLIWAVFTTSQLLPTSSLPSLQFISYDSTFQRLSGHIPNKMRSTDLSRSQTCPSVGCSPDVPFYPNPSILTPKYTQVMLQLHCACLCSPCPSSLPALAHAGSLVCNSSTPCFSRALSFQMSHLPWTPLCWPCCHLNPPSLNSHATPPVYFSHLEFWLAL